MHVLNLGVCLWSCGSTMRVILNKYSHIWGGVADGMSENDRLSIAYDQFRAWTRSLKLASLVLEFEWPIFWASIWFRALWIWIIHFGVWNACAWGIANPGSLPKGWNLTSIPILSWVPKHTMFLGKLKVMLCVVLIGWYFFKSL